MALQKMHRYPLTIDNRNCGEYFTKERKQVHMQPEFESFPPYAVLAQVRPKSVLS